VAGFDLIRNYRDSYNLFGCSGILFNHESPRRGYEFVTRKITSTAVRIKAGTERELRLGNLAAKRDWGFAGDYVDAMWRMLQQDSPDDYVIATNETHSVQEFIELTFDYLGLNWKDHVVIDKRFYRPAEVHLLKGDYSKGRKQLGWQPKIKFTELVKMMVDADLQLLQGSASPRSGQA
jgi:GDPmannose 4,6-dehydratase